MHSSCGSHRYFSVYEVQIEGQTRQDLSAQQEALVKLDVSLDRIYIDKGLTGSNRLRPGRDQLSDKQQKALCRMHGSGEY